MSKKLRKLDEERLSQIERFHLRKDIEKEEMVKARKKEIEKKLQDLFDLINTNQITDNDLGIGPEASSFVEKVMDDIFCDRFYHIIAEDRLPPPPFLDTVLNIKNISDLGYEKRSQEILQSVIRTSYELAPRRKYVKHHKEIISLSDTFHSYWTTQMALKLLSKKTLDMEEGRKVFMIGWGHDVGKSNKVLNGYGFRDPFDWVKDNSVKKWMKENLNPPPKRLDEKDKKGNLRIPHSILSAEFIRPALSHLDLVSEQIDEIYNGILHHDYAWMVLNGVQPLGKPTYTSGIIVHDADKLVRFTEILVETSLYAVQQKTTVEEMIKKAGKNAKLFLKSDGFLQSYLNDSKLKQKCARFVEDSLQYLKQSLMLYEI